MDKRHEAELAALTPQDAEENGENAPMTLVAPTDGLYSLSLGTEAAKKVLGRQHLHRSLDQALTVFCSI